MAPNKKKKGGSNGKSKKGGGGNNNNTRRGSAAAAASVASTINNSSAFGGDFGQQQQHSAEHQSGLYVRYKKATQAVKDWYASILPATFRLEYVTDLTKAADHILENNMAAMEETDQTTPSKKKKNKQPTMIVASAEIFDCLNESIELRTRVGKSYREESDDGHKYIVDCLKYCRKLLRMSQRIRLGKGYNAANKEDPSEDKKDDDEQDALGGRYNNLLLDSDGEEDDEPEENSARTSEYFRARKPTQPAPPTKEMLLDELINGDDKFHAKAFISSIADLMNLIMTNAALLKHQITKDPLRMHQHLIQFTLISNVIMERVQIMEAELITAHPHLDNFYKVLGLVYLQRESINIQKSIHPSILHRQPNIVKNFVGEVVEMGYGNNDPERRQQILHQYARAFKLDVNVVSEHARDINMVVTIERMQWKEEQKAEADGFLKHIAERAGVTPHMWFLGMGAISGKNSLLNTQYITQSIFQVAARVRSKLYPNGSELFGKKWNEETNPAKQVRGDMDTLLAEEILPELIECARDKGFCNLAYQASLCPLLGMMSAHFNRGLEKPVPASLTFGLHAMLITILLVQGNGDLSRIGIAAKASYEKLFAQLDEVSSKDQEMPPYFFERINHWKLLRRAPEVVAGAVSTTSEMNAMWNPLVAGSFLLLGTFCASVGLGSQTINCFGQRLCLQLYNAFEKVGLLKGEEVPVLKMITTAFAREKGVWLSTSPPDQGSFTRSSMLSYGWSVESAARYVHVLSSEATSSEINKNHKRFQREVRDERRQTTGVVPKRYSAIWCRLVLRDSIEDDSFLSSGGDEDGSNRALIGTKNSLVEMLSLMNLTDPDDDKKHLEGIFSQINEVQQCMKIDGDNLLPLNLPLLGGLFNQFLLDLSVHMGWQSEIDPRVALCPDGDRYNRQSSSGRNGRRKDCFETSDANLAREALVEHGLRLLTRADLHGKHENLNTGDGLYDVKRAAHFMKFYFCDAKLKREDYTFFVQPDNALVPKSN